MRFRVLAADYDGTFALHGPCWLHRRDLRRLKDSGRKLFLVTGRISTLPAYSPSIDLFDLVVAENGGLSTAPPTRRACPGRPTSGRRSAAAGGGASRLSVGR